MATPDHAEILRVFADARISELFTALPAFVKTYDPATQVADIEIGVRQARAVDEEDVEHEELAIVPNVRVIFPSASGVSITFPIAVGDTVLFVVSSLSIGEFRRKGEPSDAVQLRRNSLGCGGWAIPCRLLDADPLEHGSTDALVLEHPSSIMIGANATSAIAKGDLTDSELNTIAISIGQIAAVLNATPGPVLSAPGTVTPYVPNTVGATKGKVV